MNEDIRFSELPLHPAIQRAVSEEGYERPTPIQRETIPHIVAGRDVLGTAQTGTGKTAAFSLPLLHRLHETGRQPRPGAPLALALAPTRELASQVAESVQTYGRHLKLRHAVVFGGVNQHRQVIALRKGPHILVATPGRLLDLMQQGHVRLDAVNTLILDEADRMLDMGFLPDIRRVVAAVPRERQTLFFSATMPGPVAELAKGMLREPVRIDVAPPNTTAERVRHQVLFVRRENKRDLLHALLAAPEVTRALVFTRTKHGANKVAKALGSAAIAAEAIHGNKSQPQRERALARFRRGQVQVLVATDIAARGIDVDGVTHVFNYELPQEPENYVHRIGRTARAGASGAAYSFCDHDERGQLRDIERMLTAAVEVHAEHPYHDVALAEAHAARATITAAVRGRGRMRGAPAPRTGNGGGRDGRKARSRGARPERQARSGGPSGRKPERRKQQADSPRDDRGGAAHARREEQDGGARRAEQRTRQQGGVPEGAVKLKPRKHYADSGSGGWQDRRGGNAGGRNGGAQGAGRSGRGRRREPAA